MSQRPALPTTAGAAVRGFVRHPSPVVLLTLAIAFTVTRIALGNWTWYDAIGPLALVAVWPFYEWLIHVFLLHFRPVKVRGRTFDMKVARIHRAHHADPWDLPVSFIPFHMVWLSGIPLAIVVFWVAPSVELATGYLAAYLWLSLHYEWCHYLAHIDWCPPLGYYRLRVKLHRWHHFHHERLWWGVSTHLGDTVLGTGPDVKNAPRSSTTHDLLGAPSGKPVRIRRG